MDQKTVQAMKENARRKLKSARALSNANDPDYYNNIVEDCFFAIEIYLKVELSSDFVDIEEGELRSFNHNLSACLGARDEHLRKSISSHDREAYNLLIKLIGDAQVWRPQTRYTGDATYQDAQMYLQTAERIEKWVETTF